MNIVKFLMLMIALQAGLALPVLASGQAANTESSATLVASDTTTAGTGDTGEDAEGDDEDEEETTEEGAE